MAEYTAPKPCRKCEGMGYYLRRAGIAGWREYKCHDCKQTGTKEPTLVLRAKRGTHPSTIRIVGTEAPKAGEQFVYREIGGGHDVQPGLWYLGLCNKESHEHCIFFEPQYELPRR